MIDIGVLSPVTGGFYFGETLAGIVRRVAAAGGRVTVIQTLDAGSTGEELVRAPDMSVPVARDRLDGFLTIAWAVDESCVRELRDAGTPVVLISSDAAVDAASVVADNDECVRAAVTHLVEHGHRRIGFVGSIAQSDMRERFEAYRAAAAAHGLPDEPELHISTGDHVESGGLQAARAVAAALPGLTAVVTSTDRVALGLMEGLAALGVDVPGDLAVIGFDDVEAGWYHDPPLATVRQDFASIGAAAADLLLAEIAGRPVEHRPHVVRSELVPRRSCGCGSALGGPAGQDEADGELLAEAVLAALGPGRDAPLAPENLDDIDALVTTTVQEAFVDAPSPETLERFTSAVVGRLHAAEPDTWGAGGRELLTRAVVRVTTALTHGEGRRGRQRLDRLTVSLIEQYDVGVGLLDRVGSDPSDLRWLGDVGVRAGCLGLWRDGPEAGVLELTGVYDPEGRIGGTVPDSCSVREFPPRPLLDQADARADEVTYVIPVRGASGNHGYLCVIGLVDVEYGTGRATYNNWAALLGAALNQKRLMADLRRSEERYSLAALATRDGLWDWDVEAAECFYSARCREMLGIDRSRAADPSPSPGRTAYPELEPWTSAVHPEDREALTAELADAITRLHAIELELRVSSAAGGYRWMLLRAVPQGLHRHRASRVVGSLSDIHQRKELEEQLRSAALYDAVTGLPNRRLFLQRLGLAVAAAEHDGGPPFAVVFLDLDGFKLINDSLGHLMGDELLKIVGERLCHDLRSTDTAARFGGDEFAVLLHGLDTEAVLAVADRIQRSIAETVTLGDSRVTVGASVGITTSSIGHREPEEVLRDADIAMYHAKEADRGSSSVFDRAMHQRATARLKVESELRRALRTEQFTVHYQPVVGLGAPDAVGRLEALVRWQHPDRGLLLPGEFLPVLAESTGAVQLGRWVLDEVCAQLATWHRDHGLRPVVAVNLSHREFWSPDLPVVVTGTLARHGVPARSLVLEVTESVVMADPEAAVQVMTDLREAGIALHIDDFGTGHSSLSALRTLPVEALKIDRSFIGQITTDDQTAALVRIIIDLGRTLGVDVIAEGVETPEQAALLHDMGCRDAQGWLYSPAVPATVAAGMLGTVLEGAMGTASDTAGAVV